MPISGGRREHEVEPINRRPSLEEQVARDPISSIFPIGGLQKCLIKQSDVDGDSCNGMHGCDRDLFSAGVLPHAHLDGSEKVSCQFLPFFCQSLNLDFLLLPPRNLTFVRALAGNGRAVPAPRADFQPVALI
jgi:hypothetical protein